MIAERHKWLLRDVTTCFDYLPGSDYRCRLCRVTERGEVRVEGGERTRHLGFHRLEKIEREKPAAQVAE